MHEFPTIKDRVEVARALREASSTPGPWAQDGPGSLVVLHDGEIVAGAFGHADERRAEGLANARLIAAAPDLLVAARLVLRYFEGDAAVSLPTVLDWLRTSIARAEGRAP